MSRFSPRRQWVTDGVRVLSVQPTSVRPNGHHLEVIVRILDCICGRVQGRLLIRDRSVDCEACGPPDGSVIITPLSDAPTDPPD